VTYRKYTHRQIKNKTAKNELHNASPNITRVKVKGKVIPLQAWCGPEGG